MSASPYKSQCGQDEFIDRKLFRGKEGGFFLDIGAHDGETFSNTWYLEKHRQWKGICVEPIPEVYAKLDANRQCTKINGCISREAGTAKFLRVTGAVVDTEMLSGLVDEYDARHLERIDREIAEYGGGKEEIEVACYRVQDLLTEHGIDTVDYVSIDTEGNELAVLQSMDHKAVRFLSFTVENNYGDPAIREFMYEQGYKLLRTIEQDDVFVHPELPIPLLTRWF